MTNLFKLHHSQYIKKIEKGAKLYSNLMEYGYLPDHWVLPPFVEVKTKNTTRTGDNNTREPKVLFAPKSKLKWRQFSFIHPNNYQKVCEVITSKEYNDALLKLAIPTKIFSYTLPQTYTSSTQNAEKQIVRWTELQDDLLLFSDKYEYILVLDISNCYHTLYTHSIEWAFESIGDKKTGEKLDVAIRQGMKNRTHGIPVGSAISHYVSETVLLKIDRDIEKTKEVKDYMGGRFRDNYYILCKSKQDAELLLKEVVIVLRKHNLDFNSEKTKIIKQSEYFDNFWRIDFTAILSKLNINDKNTVPIQLPIRKIEAFVGLTLRLSQEHNNEKAIIDRLLDILENVDPEHNLYPKYFSIVQRIYQIRTQTLPKVLGLLSLIASKNDYCKTRFRQFLISRLISAYQGRDNFEMMWVIYFLSANKIKITETIKTQITKIKKLDDPFLSLICTFYEESISGAVLTHGDLFADLWRAEPNTSNLEAKFKVLLTVEDILKILKINFTASSWFGGGY